MVPAESILNLESKALLLTKSLKTPSAAGLLQMLPRHTKSTENGFVSVSVPVGEVEDAIDAPIDDPEGEKRRCVLEIEGGVGFLRERNGGCRKKGTRNGALGERS